LEPEAGLGCSGLRGDQALALAGLPIAGYPFRAKNQMSIIHAVIHVWCISIVETSLTQSDRGFNKKIQRILKLENNKTILKYIWMTH